MVGGRTKAYLSHAHEKWAVTQHRNAYMTMLYFALGTKDMYVRRGKLYYWARVFLGRRV